MNIRNENKFYTEIAKKTVTNSLQNRSKIVP
jgi:hypothetical protein